MLEISDFIRQEDNDLNLPEPGRSGNFYVNVTHSVALIVPM